MLIHRGIQVAPLPLRGSGASRFPHHFPVSLPGCCWDTGGCFWARSRDAALPLACLCLPPYAWYSLPNLNICKCCNGAPSKETPIPPSFFFSSLHFPRSFPFCLIPKCCLLCGVWGGGGGAVGTSYGELDLLCHRGFIYRTSDSWLLITRHGCTVYHGEGTGWTEPVKSMLRWFTIFSPDRSLLSLLSLHNQIKHHGCECQTRCTWDECGYSLPSKSICHSHSVVWVIAIIFNTLCRNFSSVKKARTTTSKSWWFLPL